jgi:hypothetical protein
LTEEEQVKYGIVLDSKKVDLVERSLSDRKKNF